MTAYHHNKDLYKGTVMKIRTYLATSLLLAAPILVIGCSGKTDGGSAGTQDFNGSQFVASDDQTGSISVEVKQDLMQVSETSGFSVFVRDSAGAPVENIPISCDSEEGVAILEPTTGRESTDSGGHISGVLGCEAPGSYLFGCRLPLGANKRKFVTIRCSGPVPAGFAGFPGSSGGSLGGGTPNNGNGGPGGTGTDGLSVSTVELLTISSSDAGSTSLDIFAGWCGQDDPATAVDERTPEPFSDDLIRFTVTNNSNQIVRLSSYTYSVDNVSGNGGQFNSGSIAIDEDSAGISANGTGTFTALFVDAFGGGKRFKGASSNIAFTGFRNVTFRITGQNDLGESVEMTVRKAISFDNFDNCGS